MPRAPRGRRALAAAALLLALPTASACQSPSAPSAGRPPDLGAGSRILMIGNRLTEGNRLGAMVEALGDAAGLDWEVHAVTIPNAALEDHWEEGTARRLLGTARWDAVILQQGPSTLPESRSHLRQWARVFDGPIRAAGARSALYMVWPERDRSGAYDRVRDSYALAAADVGGWFGFHPSPEGSYAVALAVYAALTGRSPVGLPSTLQHGGGTLVSVPPPLAALLQAAAAEAAATYRDYRPEELP